MTRYTYPFVVLCSFGLLICSSCKDEPKSTPAAADPVSRSSMKTPAGEAGRVEEDVFRVEAVVSAVDLTSRRVTLTGPQGKQHTFTAGPEIKNLGQLKVGDKVSATFARRFVVMVRRDDAPPSESYDTVSATARMGERPGMLVAEETKIVARVNSIDTANRKAVLEFPDHTLRTVPVRPDVDLSKYRVGDNVVIRTTTALTVLAGPSSR